MADAPMPQAGAGRPPQPHADAAAGAVAARRRLLQAHAAAIARLSKEAAAAASPSAQPADPSPAYAHLASAAHPRVAHVPGAPPHAPRLPPPPPGAADVVAAALKRLDDGVATAPPPSPLTPEHAVQLRAQQLALAHLARGVAVPAAVLRAARGAAPVARVPAPPPPPAEATRLADVSDPDATPSSLTLELQRRVAARRAKRADELERASVPGSLPPEARVAALRESKALKLADLQRRVRAHVLVERRLLEDVRVTSLFDWRSFRRIAPVPTGDSAHLVAIHGGLAALEDATARGSMPPNVAHELAQDERRAIATALQREALRKQQEATEATLRMHQINRQNAAKQAQAKREATERQRREVLALAEVVRLRRKFLADAANHLRDFRAASQAASKRRRARAESVAAYHDKARRAKSREEAARLKALRADNMEEYLRMAKAAKNQRVHDLLEKTDGILIQLGAAVEAQRSAVQKSKDSGADALEPMEDVPVNPMFKSPDKLAAGGDKGEDDIDTDFLGQKQYHSAVHRSEEKVERQPSMLKGGELRPYQLVGLQWMVSLYINNLNGILADEMGLGKTIQTISFLAYLMESKNNQGPFLIVAPKAVLPNWRNEFARWLPEEETGCKAVLYDGNGNERRDIRDNLMKDGTYNAILTHYDLIIRDRAVLQRIGWEYIIIDEGHRLKNSESKLAEILGGKYNFKHRMLLTGTPIQNNLHELWSLLNFILPTVFQSSGSFDEWFAAPFKGQQDDVALTEEESLLVINRLHQVIRPFLLRRKKAEVESELPDKVTQIIKCDMSYWQKYYYKQIAEGSSIAFGDGGQRRALQNSAMQLRKVCNHPYLFDDLHAADGADQHEMLFTEKDPVELLRAAGKFDMLDRVLRKLKAGGHRVLLFSQMTKCLDVIEDYLLSAKYEYLRLDGNTKTGDRASMLQEYNDPNSDKFIFLLSTRSGGLGLNLQTADTVIIFDSDWNPQMDAQAEDRAHRIGQKRQVLVLVFASAGTIEEDILERAYEKKRIDQTVIQAGMFNDKSTAGERKQMLEQILKESKSILDNMVEIPSDEEVNRLISRNDDEFELFMKIDAERAEEDLKANGGQERARLMTKEEMPEWVLRAEQAALAAAAAAAEPEEEVLTATGRRARKSKGQVVYHDGLTDDQFERALERGDLDEQMQRKAVKVRERRENGGGAEVRKVRFTTKAAEAEDFPAKGEADAIADADADEEHGPAAKRPRRSSAPGGGS